MPFLSLHSLMPRNPLLDCLKLAAVPSIGWGRDCGGTPNGLSEVSLLLRYLSEYHSHSFCLPMPVIDASGHRPSDVLMGSINDYGSFDECLSVRGPDHIVGQYCLLKWSPESYESENFGRMAICSPSSCSASEMQQIIHSGMRHI